MLSVVLTVRKYARTYLGYYVLLVYIPSQSARHAKWVEKNTRVRVNQNARVQFVEKHACSCKPKCTSAVRGNQRYTRAVCANHDAHGSRLTSRVYTRALDMHFHVIDLSCTRRLCCEYFQKRVELCSCLTRV